MIGTKCLLWIGLIWTTMRRDLFSEAQLTVNEEDRAWSETRGIAAESADVGRYREEFQLADLNRDHVLEENEFVAFRSNAAKSHQGDDLIDFHDETGDAKIPQVYRSEVTSTEKLTTNFWTAFLNSIAMIIVTELGDKTFFIAAVLAMRNDRKVIFIGAVSALAVMTVLSSFIGFALPSLLPREYTHYAATILFVYFGLKLLSEAYEMHKSGSSGPSDELEEVERELKDDSEVEECDAENGRALESKNVKAGRQRERMIRIATQAFTLTFLAEWGDRSQIATIALASAKDPIGVTVGGIIGHALCTGLAVVGGRLLATRISEKQVAIAGGVLFILFALHSMFTGP